MKSNQQSIDEIIDQKQALKDEAWAVSQVLLEAQESLKIVEYLVMEGQGLDSHIIRLNPFWRFSMSVHTDHVLLKLNILFTKNEHFSINGFIDKLKPRREFSGIVPEPTINLWMAEVARLRKTYKKISLQRNKRIAHKDRNPGKDLKKPITIKELKELVALVQTIVREIYQVTIGGAFQVDRPIGEPVESLHVIIKSLDEHKRSTIAPIYELAKEAGLTDELPQSER